MMTFVTRFNDTCQVWLNYLIRAIYLGTRGPNTPCWALTALWTKSETDASLGSLCLIEGENITYTYKGSADSIEKLDKVAQGLVEVDVNCPPQDPILGYWRVLAH